MSRSSARWTRLLVISSLTALPWIIACAESRPLVTHPTSVVREVSDAESAVEIELEEVRLSINADGTWKKVYVTEYVVKNQTGVDYWSETQAYFSPWFQTKPEIKATVTNSDPAGAQQQYQLDDSLLAIEPAYPQAPAVYSDAQVMRGPLPKVGIGSRVKETIVTSTHKQFLDPAYLHRMSFGGSSPVKKARFVIDAPEGLQLNFAVREAAVKRSDKKEGKRQIITFEAENLAAFKALEDSLPSDVVRLPYVSVTLGESWEGLAGVYGKVVEASLNGIDFQSTLNEIVAKKDSDDEKIHKILQWVKNNVRYVGVEFGESAVVPFAPDQTLARGFGDCKDQATLLVGLLRAAGFQAQVALLFSGTGEDIDPEQPALNVFDHAIVHVGGDIDRFLDPTADLVRWRNLPIADQGRYALLSGGSGKALVKIPAGEPSTNQYNEERVVHLPDYGKASVTETSSGLGYFDWELRDTFSVPAQKIEENLKAYTKRIYGSEEITKETHGDSRDLGAPFSSSLNVAETDVGQTWLLEASADLREGMLFSWLPNSLTEGEEDRKSPLFMHVPYQAELSWTVEAPPGFLATALPEPTVLKLGPVEIVREVEKLPNQGVRMKSRITPQQALLSAAEVNAFREAYKVWSSGLSPRVVFEHEAQALKSAGKVKEAVAMLRQSSKAGKNRAIDRLRLAKILAPYLYEDALVEAKKATSEDVKNQKVWTEYADFLTNNWLQEDLGKGYRRSEALAAYEKAQSFAEDTTYFKLRRAYILEHNLAGERYRASTEDLLQAVELYDSIPEKELREYDDGDHVHSVLFTLFWAKKYADLSARLAKIPRDEVPANLAVMNRAASSGFAAALDETKRLSLTGADLAGALEAASGTLAQTRQYADAARALDEISGADDAGGKLKTRSLMLKSLRAVDLEDLPEGSPEQLAVKIMTLAGVKGNENEALAKRYLARDAYLRGEKSGMNDALGGKPAERSALVSDEFLGDIMVGGQETQVAGNDAEGHRVRLTFRYGGGNTTWMYFTKENGKNKLRAMSGHTVEIGAEALVALQKGNKKKAERWMNWARETFRGASGEDELRLPPYARLWNDGKGDLEGAAAALAAGSDQATLALTVLQKRLAAAKTDEQRQIFTHAILHAYSALEKDDLYLKTARELYALVPKSRVAEDSLLGALYRAEKLSEYQQLVESKLKGAKKDSDKYHYENLRASVLEAQGSYKESRLQMEQMLKAHAATAGLYNELAWNGMMLGPTEANVKYALRSLEMSRSVNTLHTLACIYAEMGRINEAGEILREIMTHRTDKAPWSIDYYIVGRIAEHLSMPQSAKAAYVKIKKPEGFSPHSSYALAQKRLKKL